VTVLFLFVALGFVATAVIGLLACGLDRKVTARVQYRVGPPLWQPFIDMAKLLGKENLIPAGASQITFFAAPLVGLAAVTLVSTILWLNSIHPARGFGGDLIVALYLLSIPSISLMMGGFASGNPYASLGASREMKAILSYELPFVLAIIVPVIKSGYAIRLGTITRFQLQQGLTAGNLSGLLAFIVAVLCVQAKLGLVPFDVAEAEAEINSGPLIEYSGASLAVYRLMKSMLFFVLPFFLIMLFLGGAHSGGWPRCALKYIGLVALITVIRNTNPRLRIDQTVKFFWGPVTLTAAIAVLLALAGV